MSEPEGRGWRQRHKVPWLSNWARRTAEGLESKYTPDEQIAMAEQRVQTLIRTHGVDGGPTATARADLAERLERADRWSEARVMREEVLIARRRNLGADNEQTLSAELWLARNLTRDGMYEQALALAQHARAQAVDDEHIESAERMVARIEKAAEADSD